MAWEEVTAGTRVRFDEVGDEVEGKLTSATNVNGNDGDYMRYTVQAEDENKTFNGCWALDDVLKNVKVGSMVKVIYQGKENIGGGKSMKRFKVLVKKEESVA